LTRELFADSTPEEARDQEASGREYAAQLNEPLAPAVDDMCENRHRPHEVQAAALERERRAVVVEEDAKRRREILVEPLDARSVDVAPVEFRLLGFV
jgi:hypothetical protein